jgi:amino acid adenylation domain-containing protein
MTETANNARLHPSTAGGLAGPAATGTAPEPSPASPRTIHEAVAHWARRQPDAPAIVFRGEPISYRVLDAASDEYARALAEQGAGPGTVVPVLLRRSPQLVATLLGVLKCGAAYAALDHRWPAERIRTVLDILDPPLLVTDAPTGSGMRSWVPPTEDLPEAAARGGRPPSCTVDPSAVATVFFTSGTTGAPKGVLSPHRATTRLFHGDTFADFAPGRAMPQTAPAAWDGYTLETWGMLTSGGTSAIVEGDYLLPAQLRDLVTSFGVDTAWLTASLFNLFVDEDVECFAGMRQVLTGGERLSVPHVRKFLRRHPDIALINGYGPVESCVFVTTHRIRPSDCDLDGGIPIGTAVPRTRAVVLDGDRPVRGELGEICVAGEGLALGYLGAPEATAERFVTRTLDGRPTTLYRTGDQGVLDDSGVLHFRGRTDRQVKIAGNRIEPDDVEAAARRIPGLRECLAVAVPGTDGTVERLALFYTVEPEGGPAPAAVRRELSATLPRYLVPHHLYRREALPRTANGKLDQHALLALVPEAGEPATRVRSSAGSRG